MPGLRIVAFHEAGFAGKPGYQSFLDDARGAPGHEFIPAFTTPATLVQAIIALSVQNNHNCIEYLEIYAHGRPSSCDGLSILNAANWGTALKRAPWCDTATIALVSCNTGLKDHQGRGPIAKALADAMPFDAGSFAHHITVLGAKGYSYGSLAKGNHETKSMIFSGHWERRSIAGLPYFSYYVWVTDTLSMPYPHGADATGLNSFNSFKNGTW